ncbi:MAG: hypothetical protein A2381_00410 [Bdellovibrionales bacterium RIFOXYB1_FULL_37_110]|nr:MAG: hypothetical protein A2417_11465 [Bdellovibrionales bacterium RIFOXYC1_FULL_37_79]OFZ60856.1 MAG: hypothetical protein A2381_00410 [Bdellovibrionales bacterium RIFOXYB1_FULL_37_110]OFZ62386.1 MAG: hypothetical protein A2577_03075 [Bdellovibrionales bacterium RIFOXYD1_FULL_36_51]
MDLYQLKNFYTLCINENYTIAAQKLLISQSAVSHSIKKLEESLQKKLIDKTQKGFHLTREGMILYEHCKKINASIEKASEDLQNLQPGQLEITVGATLEFGSTVLVKQLASFNQEFKYGKIHLELSNHLLPSLLRDEVDMIIDCKLHHHKDLNMIPLFREEYVVICTPYYKKINNIITPSNLDRCYLLSMDKDGNWWHRFYYALKEEKRPTLKKLIQINHIRGIINGTIASMGVGLVPKYTIIDELNSKKIIQLFPEIKLSEDYFSIYIKKEKKSLRKFRQVVKHLKRCSI